MASSRQKSCLSSLSRSFGVLPNVSSGRFALVSALLMGVCLQAVRKLHHQTVTASSERLVPRYAKGNGNDSCSAIIKKQLRDLEFRTHIFRLALIDRLKACNDVPTRLRAAGLSTTPRYSSYCGVKLGRISGSRSAVRSAGRTCGRTIAGGAGRLIRYTLCRTP